MRYFDVTGHAV